MLREDSNVTLRYHTLSNWTRTYSKIISVKQAYSWTQGVW